MRPQEVYRNLFCRANYTTVMSESRDSSGVGLSDGSEPCTRAAHDAVQVQRRQEDGRAAVKGEDVFRGRKHVLPQQRESRAPAAERAQVGAQEIDAAQPSAEVRRGLFRGVALGERPPHFVRDDDAEQIGGERQAARAHAADAGRRRQRREAPPAA